MLKLSGLRNYLTVGIAPDGAVVTGIRRALGYVQMSVTTVVPLTLAAAITAAGLKASTIGYAVIQCSGNPIRWRDDGVPPTTTVGMNIPVGGELDYAGEVATFQVVSTTGTAVLDISFYA